MENNDVMELLDELFSMVSEAWGVPLGNDKCIIEREKALKHHQRHQGKSALLHCRGQAPGGRPG